MCGRIIIAPPSSSRIDGATMPQPPPRILPPRARRCDRRVADPLVVIDGADERLAMLRSARRFGACVAPPRIEKTGGDARGFVRVLVRCVWLRVRGICVCVSECNQCSRCILRRQKSWNGIRHCGRGYKYCTPLLNTHIWSFRIAWNHPPHSHPLPPKRRGERGVRARNQRPPRARGRRSTRTRSHVRVHRRQSPPQRKRGYDEGERRVPVVTVLASHVAPTHL